MSKIKQIVEKELFLILLIILFIILLICLPFNFHRYVSYINFEMLGILLIMMILTEALKLSGIFSFLANKLISRFHKKRYIALSLALFSAFLATFLTNDITLFIVLPIALNLKKHFNKKFWYLIIYILFAVNIGSGLTPMGNPQNIIIWRKWDIDLDVFIMKMLPYFITSAILLTIFILITFKNEKIESFAPVHYTKNSALFWVSLLWLIIFITSVELNVEDIFFLLIPIFYLFYKKDVLRSIDWGILALFLFIFLDFNTLSNLNFIKNIFEKTNSVSSTKLYIFGIALSQLISNVPTTVVLTNYTNNWLWLSLGVNIGAQGSIIGSLANIIGVRLTKEKKLSLKYHLLGIPFLLISSTIIYLVYKLVF